MASIGKSGTCSAKKYVHENVCDHCSENGISRVAVSFCYNCEVYFCESCENLHNKIVLGHNLDYDNSHKNEDHRANMSCPRHSKDTVRFYCEYHNVVFCHICRIFEHKACFVQDIFVDDEYVNVSEEFKDTYRQLQRLTNMADTVLYEKKMELETFDKGVNETRNKIELLRKQINSVLDDYQVQISLQEYSFINYVSIAMQTCTSLSNELKDQIKCMKSTKRNHIKEVLLLSESKQMCRIYGDALKDIRKAVTKHDLSILGNDKLLVLMKEVCDLSHQEFISEVIKGSQSEKTTVGKNKFEPKSDKVSKIAKKTDKEDEIKIVADNLNIAERKTHKEAVRETVAVNEDKMETKTDKKDMIAKETDHHTTKSFLNIKSCSPIKETDVRVRNDIKVPYITGCCWLSDDELFLCDNNNRNVKILDKNMNIKFTAPCISDPFDIDCINAKTVVVTMPDIKTLQFVAVKPGFKFKHTKCINARCLGIAVHEKNIFVCIDDAQQSAKCIKVLTLDGDNVTYIPHLGPGSPRYLCLNRHGTRIYYTGGSNKEMFINSLTNDGHGIFSVSSTDLHYPRGVVIDEDGNVIVCDDAGQRLQVIASNGKFGQTLLSKKDNILYPKSVCVNRTLNILVIASWKQNPNASKLALYKLEYE